MPTKRRLLVLSSTIKTRKGLLRFKMPGSDMGRISIVVAPAASVPLSSTLRTAWWRTCGEVSHMYERF